MAQVQINLKLNVDLQIKAEREDIPQLTDSVKSQLADAFVPAVLIANGQRNVKPVEVLPHLEDGLTPSAQTPVSAPIRNKSRRVRRTGSTKGTAPAEDIAVDWVNDPNKWGHPAQSWSTAEKCLWLLYVVKQERAVNGLNRAMIAATFRKHFRQAGVLYPHLVSRELGKLKSASPALVGEDSTVNPSQWFLTAEGIKRAENLVAQNRSQSAQTTT